MTIEDKLKEYILSKYRSINEFSHIAGVPQPTIATIFRRGVNNASVGSMMKICKTLNISADELAKGNIVSLDTYIETHYQDAQDVLKDMRLLLYKTKLLDGRPVEDNEIEDIVNAIDVGVEIAKRKNIKDQP